VESYWKGSLGRTVQVRVPGGELGRYRNVVIGAPQFALDQEVIVFLGASGPMIPYILGFNQGVYRLAASATGDTLLVTPPPMLPSAVQRTVARGDAGRRPMPLGEFESRVRALAGGGR
jgi:hypothetical protein